MLKSNMKLKSRKTGKTYIVNEILDNQNKVYMSDVKDNNSRESHILNKVIELIESGYYTVVYESEECKYIKKYCLCELSGKRCSKISKYDYITKEWDISCKEFKDLKLI